MYSGWIEEEHNCSNQTISGELTYHKLILSLPNNLLKGIYGNGNTGRGSKIGSVSASQAAVPRPILASGKFFRGINPSSTDSRRASCQLLEKEWALNIGKLTAGGLPRNSVGR